MSALISLRDITRRFTSGEIEVQVLHGISLEIGRGEFVAIMGASGSGKSTLMNILGCLDKPSGGEYLFAGHRVADLDTDGLAALRREAFGFVFQSYHLIPSANALENVEIPAIYAGLPAAQRHQRASELLTRLGLADRLRNRPSQLSGGQQQRVSIARALMNDAEVILADEPTGALDSKSGQEVLALLKELSAQGKTVIIITHDREVAAHADRQIEIRDGLIVADSGSRERNGAAPVQLAINTTPAGASSADVGEAVRMAGRALKANLFRTVLTLLGIVIGVASVVAMLAVGNGARQSVVDRISAMGTNLLSIRPGAPNMPRSADGVTATLTAEDAKAVGALPNVRDALGELQGNATLRSGNIDYKTQITATNASMPEVREWPLTSGAFFSENDERAYAAVTVLGQTVAENLFPGQDPVGQYLLISNVPFQVVGVMSAKGATPWGQDQDDVALVPFSTGSLRLFGQRYVQSITAYIDDIGAIADTEEAIRQELLKRHNGVEDFQIRNTASLLEAVTATQDTLTVLLGSIAAISLLVGGIGVMNIMLVNVTERTREIGIRMATGARTGNILQQFITEALVVSAIGGVIGVLAGLGAAWVIQALGTAVQFTLAPVLLAFGCAFATGLVFGLMPARKAAHLDPVQALASD
ncbi:MacB family efflux pump subunit [Pseudomonas sp. Z8(2022)]|jgi:macrolide transport system ATP-binding/permease protein|uniref:MacB family efflux pump subunit n=1 Tax=Pseudomonas sp. Z8(2022) TaxID=2962597 RepID=UPI0021F45A55|nr:MacB family efflux pump subunit [Pseudomonas sp. Z8(2022)]UYP29791.1 MacB family efflux pump subunit [Pseudomonas sp. Z8(2022)]